MVLNNMKKTIALLMAVAALSLSGCNEQVVGWGSLSFHHVHIQMLGQSEPVHLLVTSWRNDEGGIELKTKNFGTILVGDGTYLAYDVEECPICGTVSYK